MNNRVIVNKKIVGVNGRKQLMTRSQLTASLSEHKCAFSDHATQENHVIDWAKATVIDRESHRPTRWIKEAIHIRKEGQQAMNRDEGSYQVSTQPGVRPLS